MKVTLRSTRRLESGVETHSPRRGFTLVEVIVSMVLLAIAVSSLAGLTHSVSQSSIKVTGAAYRNGVLMQEINRLVALPFDQLGVGTTSFSTASGNYPHSRIVTVDSVRTNVKTVKVIVTPTNPLYKPDTLQFTRTNARTSRVLCTICNDRP